MQKNYPKTTEEVKKLKAQLGRQAMPPQVRSRLADAEETPDKEEPDGKLRLEDLNLRQWNGWILEENAADAQEFLEEKVLPWLQISEKMGVHIHMQATSITALQRKGGATHSVGKLTERVAPIIALKEDVDDHLSKLCTELLEAVESAYEEAQDEE